MSGPATQWWVAGIALSAGDPEPVRAVLELRLSPTQIDAMDAAALLVGELSIGDADAAGKAIITRPIHQLLPSEERAALRLLLEREIQRRKEARNG